MEKETSCVNVRAILNYVNVHKGDVTGLIRDLDPEINALPDPSGFLADPNNWVSCEVVCKLYERARILLQDEMAAYRIARYAVENISLGYAQNIIVKAFWSSKRAIKHAQRINDKFNRNKRVEVVELRRNKATIRLHWLPQVKPTKDMCLNNQGVYTFLPLVWGGKPLTLQEECCFFEGAKYCEYHLSWPLRNRFYEILSRVFTSKSVLMDIITEMEDGKEIIQRKYEEVNQLNAQLDRKIRQLTAIQETGKAILSVLDLEQLLTIIMNLLADVCRVNRALIMLVNEKEQCLEYVHAMGFQAEVPAEVKKYRVPLSRMSNMFARVTNTGRAEYVPEVKSSHLKDYALLTYGKPTSIYVVPLISRSKVIGIIATDAVDGKGVPEETRDLLGVFAAQIAIAIDNAMLYRSQQEQMLELKRSRTLLSRVEKFSFLGNVAARLAHEIKNPMTAIGTFIQLLPQKYEDQEFRSSFYRLAMEETTRVNNLITELLDLVKTKESHFESSDLHELVEKMVLLLSPQSKAKKIKIVRNFDPKMSEIWIDPEKMKQTILNILSNAVDFSPENGEIEIGTRMEFERESWNIIIEIKDDGIGIPPSVMDRIFDPYFTTKYKSNMHSGTGLGLFIAHQNVHDHGGEIEVKSREREGATFIIKLPLREPPVDEKRIHPEP